MASSKHHRYPADATAKPACETDRSDFPRCILAQWGLPAESTVELIAASENETFLTVAPDGARVVFRIHRAGYNDAAEIASEHAWIAMLRGASTIETPAVLRRSDGATIGTALIGGQPRHVAAFAFMQGREPSPDDERLPAWFARLGTLTAKLHRQSRAWTIPPDFRRKHWTFETTLGSRPHWGDWRNALGLTKGGQDLLGRAVRSIEARLASYGVDSDRFGLIHADLRLANLLVEGDRLGVIDFDDCGFGWFLYDFAASVSFIEHEPIVESLREAWVEGYRAEGVLSPADEAMLPVFVALRRILLTAWIAARPDADAARSLGSAFTRGTLDIAERFLVGSLAP